MPHSDAPILQYELTAGSVLALLIILAVLWNRRKNAKIYALLDGEFKIVRRVRISYIDPIVDLTSAAVQSRVSEYIITIDRWATKRLNNQRLRILCLRRMVRERNIPFAFHFITIYRGEQRSNSRKR